LLVVVGVSVTPRTFTQAADNASKQLIDCRN